MNNNDLKSQQNPGYRIITEKIMIFKYTQN